MKKIAFKKSSPQIAATMRGAMDSIYKAQKKYGTYNGETKQGTKHISFCFTWLLQLMESALESEND